VIGWVKMRKAIPFAGKIKSTIVSRVADRWFVSLSTEVDHIPPIRENRGSAATSQALPDRCA
jgi:putative transposase